MHVPEGWSEEEVPSTDVSYQMPPTVRPMIRLVPPGKDGTASISEMKVVTSLDEAAKRYVRGMPMRGIAIDSAANVIQNGHEGKHVKGHLAPAGNSQTFPVEVYIIMTQECILSVEVISKEASPMINEVLSWIEFQTAAVSSKDSNTHGSAGRRFWLYLGMSVFFMVVGYAVYHFNSSHRRMDHKP